MKTPIIIGSDLHIDDYKPFSQGRDRLEDCLKVLDDLFKLADKKQSKYIVLGGDLYNTVRFLMTTVVDSVIARFAKLFKKYPEISVYSITGNHDFATKNLPDIPAISAISHLAVAFPNRFILFDNERVELNDNAMIAGIPNYEFPEHYKQKLQEMHDRIIRAKRTNPNTKVTLFIHQKPSGMLNPNVKIDTYVDDPLYDAFDLVLCGDIHHKQIVTPKFIILGNPLHRDLGDEGEEKGIWYMDAENPVDTIKFVTRKGRYPEFVRVRKGEEDTADANNFLIVEPQLNQLERLAEGVASLDKFGSQVNHKELVTNYINEVKPNDRELLKSGLGFLN